MAGNYIEPLESEPRVVELWVGNYPKETTQVGNVECVKCWLMCETAFVFLTWTLVVLGRVGGLV